MDCETRFSLAEHPIFEFLPGLPTAEILRIRVGKTWRPIYIKLLDFSLKMVSGVSASTYGAANRLKMKLLSRRMIIFGVTDGPLTSIPSKTSKTCQNPKFGHSKGHKFRPEPSTSPRCIPACAPECPLSIKAFR